MTAQAVPALNATAARDAVAQACEWIREDALPLWRERGWDQARGGFVERLRPDGTPDFGAARRMRVQARQVFVYASAARLGWCGPETARTGLDWFLTQCWAADGAPGFVHMLNADGSVQDGRRDAYDQAFGLLALAAAYRLDPSAKLRGAIDAAVAFADQALQDPVHGGWRESANGGLPRRQNPQMHGFECLLALFEATGDAAFLARAEVKLALLCDRLIDKPSGALGEYFDESWTPCAGDEGRLCEPGHHFEWVWLLGEHARLTGAPIRPEAERLWKWAVTHGLNADGWAIDEVLADGAVRHASRRLWPQTELIKALLARAERGDRAAFGQAAFVLQRLLAHYGDVPAKGGWVDRFDGEGRISDPLMPASSFYHIFVAIAEADRVSRALGAQAVNA